MTKPLHKRISAVLLAVILLLAMLPVCVSAAESGTCGENVRWSLSGGVLQISGEGKMANYKDELPAPWQAFAGEITRVTVGEGVTTVGSYAFCGLSGLVSVSLPQGLERIGERAFKGCTVLPVVVFPSTLKQIDDAAFESCTSLNNIRFPASLTTIRDYAFYRCESLTSICIPETVFYLGRVVFAYCKNLSQAVIHSCLTKLPDSTFYACKSLTKVVLPETLTMVGEHVFYNCGELDSIYYSGEQQQELFEQIKASDENISPYIVMQESEFDGKSTTIILPSDEEVVYLYTESTVNYTTTIKLDTIYTYIVDGKPVTVDEIASVDPDKLTVESETKAEMTATVENDDGIREVTALIKDTAKKYENLTVKLDLTQYEIDGESLASLAGNQVQLNTPDGTHWILPSATKPEQYDQDSYSLNTKVELQETPPASLEATKSDATYKVKFGGNTNFNTTVGVYVGNSYSTATLYEELPSGAKKVQSSLIDKAGMAWFNLASVGEKTDYYVSVNDESAKEDTVLIPPTLYGEYNLSGDSYSLMDENGVVYEITGRTSSFGISGGQFALYVAGGMFVIVLIVSCVMIALNHSQKAKEKYFGSNPPPPAAP